MLFGLSRINVSAMGDRSSGSQFATGIVYRF
jgi:hypothetical protein